MLKTWKNQTSHWMIVGAAFLVTAIVLGLANVLYSVFLIPVTEGLDMSRGAYSTASSVAACVYLFSSATFPVLYRRFGFRKPAALCAILMMLTYVGYAFAKNLLPFFIGAVVYGLSEAFLNTAGISQLLTNWFYSHRGKVLGVVMAASGLGGAVLSIVMNTAIEHSGWRIAFGLGAALLLAAAVLIFTILRDTPEEKGLKPYEVADGLRERSTSVKMWDGFTLRQWLGHPIFYITMVAVLLGSICAFGSYPILTAHLQDQGFSGTFAAACYSVLLFGLAIAKISIGALCDRYGVKLAMYVCMLCGVVGIFIMSDVNVVWIAIASAILQAVFCCTTGFIQPLLTLDMFGKIAYTEVLSIMLSVFAAGNIIASPMVNMIYDHYHTYSDILVVLSIMAAISTALYVVAFSMNRKLRAGD